jgi:hypothetical protein
MSETRKVIYSAVSDGCLNVFLPAIILQPGERVEVAIYRPDVDKRTDEQIISDMKGRYKDPHYVGGPTDTDEMFDVMGRILERLEDVEEECFVHLPDLVEEECFVHLPDLDD